MHNNYMEADSWLPITSAERLGMLSPWSQDLVLTHSHSTTWLGMRCKHQAHHHATLA